MTTDIAAIQDALVADIADSCCSDYGYLRSVVRSYVESFDEAIQRQMFKEMLDNKELT